MTTRTAPVAAHDVAGEVEPTRQGSEPTVTVDTHEALRQRVLDEMKTSNVDVSDENAVTRLIERQVSDYQRDARAGVGRPLFDVAGVVGRLTRSVLEYGPLTPFLTAEPLAEEHLIKGGEISYFVDGHLRTCDETVSEAEMLAHVQKLLNEAGTKVDEGDPVVTRQILGRRARITVSIPPAAECLDAVMRRYMTRFEDFTQLFDWDALTPAAAGFLALHPRSRSSLLIVGPPGSGKTTMANAILQTVPPTMVVRCIEDTPELQIGHLPGGRWTVVPPGPTGEGGKSMYELGERALQAAPDLLVLGETKGPEAFLITRLANAGTAFLTTNHANSAALGLQALVSTAILAGANVPERTVRQIFTDTIDTVAFMEAEPAHLVEQGRRRRRQVMEIAVVPSLQPEHEFALEPIFKRSELGAPLEFTGNALPPDLARRLERSLSSGVRLNDVLEGREEIK
jgi:pilus assembly protein CpaF